ncbi:DUF2963 domain-containing protein [Candidatus Phytoplasma pruni]|uniref:DUF2963 domain-containing protein n=1 Tax=Candidatus Phytoplasma pruni TaxID=479893 RepID=A0A851H9M9_9MOLU|nr:DUF2963 domain-containing protein [Candidatus Phytoplasma pruni]NWN45642.1 DUF2963 domain-containing protein [Candidatus Phytoplasma pruni]
MKKNKDVSKQPYATVEYTDQLGHKVIALENFQGIAIKKNVYLPNETETEVLWYTSEHDPQTGIETKATYYKPDGTIDHVDDYNQDPQKDYYRDIIHDKDKNMYIIVEMNLKTNQKIKETHCSADGTIETINDYENNLLTKKTYYADDGTISFSKQYFYDNNNDLIKTIFQDDEGDVLDIINHQKPSPQQKESSK